MKKIIPIFLAVFFLACQDDKLLDVYDPSSDSDDNETLATKALITSPTFDWETIENIIINNSTVILPWMPRAASNIPYFITADNSKKDGWEMIYNTCTIQPVEKNQYYLIFYNQFTGVLRGYYYSAEDISSGSSTFWSIDIQGSGAKTKLLNATGYFSLAADQQGPISIYANCISKQAAKALTQGWNCFEVDLSYDSAFEKNRNRLFMAFGAYDVLSGTIDMTGDIKLNTEGTMVTTTGEPSTMNKLVNSSIDAGGASAKDIVKEAAIGEKNKSFFPNLAGGALDAVATGSATEIIKYGINKIFGSFLGRGGSTSSTTGQIKLSTSGKITGTASFSSKKSSPVKPLSYLLLPGAKVTTPNEFISSYNEPLGAWSLKEVPIIYCGSDAIFTKGKNDPKYDYSREIWLPRNIGIHLNPAIEDKISSCSVSYETIYYEKLNGDKNWPIKEGIITRYPPEYVHHNYTVKGGYKKIFDDGANVFYSLPGGYSVWLDNNLPAGYNIQYGTYTDRTKSHWTDKVLYYQEDLRNIDIPNLVFNLVVKVTVTITPKAPYNTTPITTTKTYIPKIEYKQLLDPVSW